MRMNKATVIILAWAAALFFLSVAVPAYSAALSVQLPDGCVPQLSGYTVTCATSPDPGPGPGPTPGPGGGAAACGAAGYSMTSLDIPYPIVGNSQIATTGVFGNWNAIVVHFRTPAAGVNDAAVFQPAGFAPSQNTSRVYALGTAPCLFAAGPNTDYLAASQSPAINIKIGKCTFANQALCPAYGAWLKPLTDYYVTMVNRTSAGGQPSCAYATCPMRIDFNK